MTTAREKKQRKREEKRKRESAVDSSLVITLEIMKPEID